MLEAESALQERETGQFKLGLCKILNCMQNLTTNFKKLQVLENFLNMLSCLRADVESQHLSLKCNVRFMWFSHLCQLGVIIASEK